MWRDTDYYQTALAMKTDGAGADADQQALPVQELETVQDSD